MWKATPGLCQFVVGQGSYSDALTGKILCIYGGPEPASSADAITEDNPLLCVINPNGEGLLFEPGVVAGTLVKDPLQLWAAPENEAGTATFFRIQADDDMGGGDPDALRLQGSVGTVSGEMLLANTTFFPDAPRALKHFTLTVPSV